MKFFDVAKPLYLETNASGVALRAGLLHMRDGVSCNRDEAPDKNTLRPITFASKSLSAAEKKIQ